jgi:hypothetical protein
VRSCAAIVTALGLVCSCRSVPAEPGNAPAPTESAAPAVAPLAWDAPPMWPALPKPKDPAQKADYQVPHAGDAKGDGDVTVFFFGTGAQGDEARRFAEWQKQFEGPEAADVQRNKLDGAALPVDLIELHGTYKTPMGPAVGPQHKAPMEIVKKNYRLIGAVVKTPDRGNWFFKLTGAEDTVQSARSAFYAMVRSAK